LIAAEDGEFKLLRAVNLPFNYGRVYLQPCLFAEWLVLPNAMGKVFLFG
jgi:hypothetical protein